ncbi:unnamed protein product [Linum tenue]|uniref:Uncharacterized protein n=1 Tax=Linum tenue TaxID=586396 RepID=A0AAV0KQI1_9ROSI|nr:unnamed protein product [Linum tenue]
MYSSPRQPGMPARTLGPSTTGFPGSSPSLLEQLTADSGRGSKSETDSRFPGRLCTRELTPPTNLRSSSWATAPTRQRN